MRPKLLQLVCALWPPAGANNTHAHTYTHTQLQITVKAFSWIYTLLLLLHLRLHLDCLLAIILCHSLVNLLATPHTQNAAALTSLH